MTRVTEQRRLLVAYDDGEITRRQFAAGALKAGLTVSGAAGLLAGCHSARRKAAPARLSGRVQMLIGFDGGNTAGERQVQQTLAQAFIAAHPQVGIDFLRATSAVAAETQLRALVSRGAAPDIVLGIGLADVSRLVDQHLWLDLQPLLRRDGISTGGFNARALSAARVPSYFGGSHSLVGLPLGMHDHAVAYNMDLFAKAGLPAPPPSWTETSWAYTSSFVETAQALTLDRAGKHAGQPGFDASQVVQYGAGRFRSEAVFYSFGGHMYDGSKRRAEFDTPAAIQGAQFAGDLVGRYRVQPTAADLARLGATAATAATAGTAGDELAAWRAGKLAMIDLCSCEIDGPFGTPVGFAWKAAALPAGPSRRFGVLDVSLGAIVAPSAQHDLAWEVLKFFAVDQGRQRQLAYGGFGAMPALTANLNAFPQGIKQSVGVDTSVWVAGLPRSSTEFDAWIPAFVDVRNLFGAAMADIAGGSGAASVMQQLQSQAQARIDAWFRANKLPGSK